MSSLKISTFYHLAPLLTPHRPQTLISYAAPLSTHSHPNPRSDSNPTIPSNNLASSDYSSTPTSLVAATTKHSLHRSITLTLTEPTPQPPFPPISHPRLPQKTHPTEAHRTNNPTKCSIPCITTQSAIPT